MKIALLQADAVTGDIDANLETIRQGAIKAEADGAALLLTPELFVSGYAPVELRSWLAAGGDSEIEPKLQALASDTEIAIAASFPLLREDGTATISAGLWAHDGSEVLRYDKVHLWGEDEKATFVAASDAPEIAEWNGWNVAFQICYDIEFAEPTRMLASHGANLVLVPTAIDDDAHYVSDLIVPTRAAENGIVVAYADHARPETHPERFTGRSVVASWDGSVLGKAADAPELLMVDLPEPASVPGLSSNYLRDRRADVYAAWRESDLPRRTAL